MESNSTAVSSDETLATLFLNARSQNGFTDQPVSDALLQQLYELVKMGPTATNCQPGRFLFVRSEEEKAKLVGCMAPPNQPKVGAAPVSVIIGMDLDFLDTLPRVFPHMDARPIYAGNEEPTAFRNSSLQGGYLIMAARALGLDCGPMSGFNPQAVDDAFWSGTNVRTNFVCTLGYGDPSKIFPRLPRLAFDEACKLV
ncbi:MAG: malonic semialdehyde reductase [Sphingorhabdus sp.]